MHSLHKCNHSLVSKFLYLPISIIRGCALILILQIACLTLKSLRNVYCNMLMEIQALRQAQKSGGVKLLNVIQTFLLIFGSPTTIQVNVHHYVFNEKA